MEQLSWRQINYLLRNNFTGSGKTIFSVVRYGNVIGPEDLYFLFQNLINSNTDHMPITHPEMTRFWITLDQGVSLCLKILQECKAEKYSFLKYLQF